jgi:type I restriction enzyme R subunit
MNVATGILDASSFQGALWEIDAGIKPSKPLRFPPQMRTSEAATRAKLIDPLLTEADWNLNDRTQVDFEIPVDGYDKEPWNGITDYCLFHPSGEVLAVVEAKKTSRDPREGQEQLRIYLDKVAARKGQTFVPFGFMTNGKDVLYWDSGAENPRLVAGFFTRDDLKRLLFIRQNGMPLQSEPAISMSPARARRFGVIALMA